MNRRHCQRSRFVALAPVRDLLTDANLGYIADISTGGMQLVSPRRVGHPDHRRVAITLPGIDKQPVTVTGEIRIAWQHSDTATGGNQTGCQFVQFTAGDKLNLLRTARSFCAGTA